jgi:histidinol phosphatase-like enzyme
VIAALLFHHVRSRKKRIQRCWIHPVFLERSTRGAFHLLYCDLRKHDIKMFNYARMSVETFDQLLQLIRNEVEGRDINFRLNLTCVGDW